ncbi:MAG: PD40 domain-containing protein [Crocinitomicaceae bacterium]|nr:PD40 domain-containing protein [Crocinitomicaceae bacterium]
MSYFDGTLWSVPVPLSNRVNSGFDEDGPYLCKDGNTLYFSSKGHNTSGGYDFLFQTGEWRMDNAGKYGVPYELCR